MSHNFKMVAKVMRIGEEDYEVMVASLSNEEDRQPMKNVPSPPDSHRTIIRRDDGRDGYINDDSGRERDDYERRNPNVRDCDEREPRIDDGLTDAVQGNAKINDDRRDVNGRCDGGRDVNDRRDDRRDVKEDLERTPNNSTKENIAVQDLPLKSSLNSLWFTCPECKFMSRNQQEMEQHFEESHDMSGAFPCTCGQCFSNMAQFLAHYITCPIAATDLQHNGFTEGLLTDDDDEISVEKDELDNSDQVYDNQSPIIQSREPTPAQTDDSNDLPLDFHIHSPTFSNPLNLVKNEITTTNKDSPIADYSVNAIGYDSNHHSSILLPELNATNNTSSLSKSSQGNAEQSKKNGKLYDCEHCEKNFKSKGLLDQHKHLHFPPRHECEFCGRRFRWPPQFYTHKQQCSKRKLGNTESRDLSNAKKHSFDFSPIVEARMQQQQQQLPGKNFSHSQITEQCLCGYKSGIVVDMFDHKRSCITSARAMILQKLIDYKTIQTSSLIPTLPTVNCNPLSSPTVHSVMQNFITNSTSSTTYSSDTVTNTRSQTTTNVNNNNITSAQMPKLYEEKPFECDFCESRFMTKISLKQHLDGKHSDQAKYCCEKCGKGYFWNASYNYHKKKCTVKPLLG